MPLIAYEIKLRQRSPLTNPDLFPNLNYPSNISNKKEKNTGKKRTTQKFNQADKALPEYYLFLLNPSTQQLEHNRENKDKNSNVTSQTTTHPKTHHMQVCNTWFIQHQPMPPYIETKCNKNQAQDKTSEDEIWTQAFKKHYPSKEKTRNH